MDIIIFAGQSNMQGSTGEKDTSGNVSNAFEYKYLTDSLEPLCNPVGEDIEKDLLLASALKNGSLVPSFCKTYITKTEQKVVAIHTAKGNSSIKEWQKGTERFAVMINKIKKGIAKVKENYNLQKIYIVWLQGESDALNFTGTENYLQMLIQLKNDIKSEIEFDKFAIIRQGYFAEFAPWIKKPVKDKKKSDKEIMKALDLAPKKDGDFYMLTKVCAKLSKDKRFLNDKEYGPHYNNKGMEIIGNKAGKRLAEIRRRNGKLIKEI